MSAKSQKQNADLYDSNYLRFKIRQSQYVAIEAKSEVTQGRGDGFDWEGAWVTIQGDKNVLWLDLGVSVCRNSSSCRLKIYILYCV